MELYYGSENSDEPREYRSIIEGLVARLELLRYDEAAAFPTGLVRRALKTLGRPIGAYHGMFAGHAVAGIGPGDAKRWSSGSRVEPRRLTTVSVRMVLPVPRSSYPPAMFRNVWRDARRNISINYLFSFLAIFDVIQGLWMIYLKIQGFLLWEIGIAEALVYESVDAEERPRRYSQILSYTNAVLGEHRLDSVLHHANLAIEEVVAGIQPPQRPYRFARVVHRGNAELRRMHGRAAGRQRDSIPIALTDNLLCHACHGVPAQPGLTTRSIFRSIAACAPTVRSPSTDRFPPFRRLLGPGFWTRTPVHGRAPYP